MSKTIQISDEIAQLLGPDERLCQTLTEAVVLELLRERRISIGKAAELLELSYGEFINVLQTKNIPVVTTPGRDPEEVADLLRRARE